MSDLKTELARKKARLEAIRREKKSRETSRLGVKDDGALSDAGSMGSTSDLRQTTEELLKTLGLPPAKDDATTSQATDFLDGHDANSHETFNSRSPSIVKRRKNLEISTVFETVIPPSEPVNYSKETQTIELPSERESRPTNYYVLTYDVTGQEDLDASAALAELEKMPHMGLGKQKHGRSNRSGRKLLGEDGRPMSASRLELSMEGLPELVPEYTEEEKNQILLSEGFLRFFDRSTRVVERALCEPADLFFDYSGGDGDGTAESDELLKEVIEFSDDRWSKHRSVTTLDWSTVFPELMLASYHTNEQAAQEPEGVCLLWNLKYANKRSPEYIFHCQSPVTSASLARFHPNLVIGGTYSGQIVLWDSRVNKRTPVQRSPLTSWAHTHPVNAVTVVGTQNAHNIISLASDGSLCAWSLEMLAQPREKGKVCDSSTGGLFDVHPTCMSFFANDVNNYAIGAENGNAYTEQRHSSRSTGPDDAQRNVPYKGHSGPITAISTHPSPGSVSFSFLFLTASLDCTVRLWSARDHRPVHTFDDCFDYVLDVNWSPVHPAVFAACDCSGHLDVWNINNDIEVPSARHPIGAGGRSELDQMVSGSTHTALNKCRWDASGNHLAVGDNQGRVTVCNVHEKLAQPSSDEWTNLAHSLVNIKHYTAETETHHEP